MKHGCILRRPCLCLGDLPLAKAVCPAHQIWPRISIRVRANDFPPPPVLFGGKVRSRAEIQSGGCGLRIWFSISPHCFRRVATQELKVTGATDTQIKGAGCWRGMGFRAYEDTQLTDSLKISRLVATATVSDSDDDPDAPANVAFVESMRKRFLPFPARELV